MKRSVATLAVLVLALALATACKKDKAADETATEPTTDEAAKTAPGGEQPTDEQPTAAAGGDDALCAQAAGLFKAMGDAMAAGGEDCDKVAEALTKVNADHKAAIDALKASDADPAKSKEMEEKCKPTLDPVMQEVEPKMEATMKACGEHEGVGAAMSALMN